jgi:hypothetical protein
MRVPGQSLGLAIDYDDAPGLIEHEHGYIDGLKRVTEQSRAKVACVRRRIQLACLGAFYPGDKVFAIALQKDGKIEVTHAVDGQPRLPEISRIASHHVARDLNQRSAHSTHRGRHVSDLETDLHVHSPDSRMPRDEVRIEGATEEVLKPSLERSMKPFGLDFVLEYFERPLVHPDDRIKLRCNRRKAGASEWQKCGESPNVGIVEADVTTQFVPQDPAGHHESTPSIPRGYRL